MACRTQVRGFNMAATININVHQGLAVPASPSAHANSIIVQGRAHTPAHIKVANKADYLAIPPMSMVFRLKTTTPRETQTHVRNLFANAECLHKVANNDLSNIEFRGVSIDGLGGKDALQFGEARNRFAVITRGIATLMINNAHLKKIKVGSPVKYEFGRTGHTNSANAFITFATTPIATLVECGHNDSKCIGELISKPKMNDQTNWCSVLLYGI